MLQTVRDRVLRVAPCFFLSLGLAALPACERLASYTEQEHVERARDFHRQGKFNAAQIELKNALAKNPKNADARWLLGETYVELSRGPEAEEELKRAREFGIRPEALKVALGNALLLQRNYRRVLDEIKPGSESSQPNMARILEIQARAQLGLAKRKEGCALFDESLKKDANHIPAHWGLALCDVYSQKPDDARARLEQALKIDAKNARTWTHLGDLERGADRLEAAARAYTSALQHRPEHVDAILGRAAVRLQEKNWKQAEKDIDQALLLAKGYPLAIYLRGALAYGQGKYPEAKTLFETALNANPNLSPALLWLGFAEYALQNFETSATHLSQFLTRHPNATRVHALLALVRARSGGTPETQKMLKTLQEAKLEDAKSLMLVGQAYYLLKEGDLAVQQLERAVALEPDEPDSRLHLALALVQKGRMADAVEQLENTLRIKPDLRNAEEMLVQALIWDKRFDAALKAADAFQAKYPDLPAPPTYRGSILLMQDRKNLEPARREFQRALKLDRGYVPAAHNLAMLAWSEGKADEARQHYKDVLKQKPDDLPTLMGLYGLEVKAKRPAEARRYLASAAENHPQAPAPSLLLGQVLLTEGNPLKAIEVTRVAARTSPNSDALVELRAAAFRATGDTANALANYRRLVQLRPGSADAQFEFATAHAALKDRAAYREALLKALALAPAHLRARSALARLDLAEGRPAEAVRIARELQKELPKDPEGFILEAEALRLQGDAARSVQVMEQYQKQNDGELQPRALLVNSYVQAGAKDKALKLARETEAANPGHPYALELLAQTQTATGDPKGAVETYLRLARVDPKSAASQFKLAQAHQSAGEAGRASAALRKTLELQPDHLEAQIALVAAEARAGRTQEAIKIAKQIQTQRPAMGVGHMLEGDAWMAQKEYAKAVRAFDAGFKAQASSGVALKLHAALERAGNSLEADSRLEQWLKDSPADFPARLYLADAYMQRGQDELAVTHYQLILQSNARSVPALNNLAWLYHKQRRPKALEMAELAYKAAPDNPEILDTLGWILLEQGNVKRAAPLLERALSLAPNAVAIRYHHAVALAKSGDKAKARAEIESLLASGKKFPEEQQARQFLQRL